MGSKSSQQVDSSQSPGEHSAATHSASPWNATFLKNQIFFSRGNSCLVLSASLHSLITSSSRAFIEDFWKHRFRTALNTNRGFVSRYSHCLPMWVGHALFNVVILQTLCFRSFNFLHQVRHCIHNAFNCKQQKIWWEWHKQRFFLMQQKKSWGKPLLMLQWYQCCNI